MVWLKRPESQLSKTFFWIVNLLNIKKVMGRNVWMCFVLTVLTYIALYALHALILCLDSVDIHNIQHIAPFDPLKKPLHPFMYTHTQI